SVDIICSTRGAYNGRVKVYDGAAALTTGVDFDDPTTWPGFLTPATGLSTPLIANIKVFGAAYKGGVSVASGDVNGDGDADIIVGTTAGAPAKVAVYSGAGAHAKLGSNIFPFGAGFTGGVNVASGDVDGDGRADVIVGSASKMARVKVY